MTRRTLLGTSMLSAGSLALAQSSEPQTATPPYEDFPAIEPTRVYDTVRFAHFDLDRVKALVEKRPALANAAVDWGFGDWESAIGAAAHMGRADIADVLLQHGARPDLFTYAMLGHLAVVRATIEAEPGIQRAAGPHGFSLLHHARSGEEAAKGVVEYLEELGDADPAPSNAPLRHMASAFAGIYAWSAHPNDRVEITEEDGTLSLGYGEGFPRTLFHVGDEAFYPIGAQAVRVQFSFEDGRATSLRIHDPDLILDAKRLSE